LYTQYSWPSTMPGKEEKRGRKTCNVFSSGSAEKKRKKVSAQIADRPISPFEKEGEEESVLRNVKGEKREKRSKRPCSGFVAVSS